MGRNLRWSIVTASRPQRRMAVQDDGPKLRLFQACQTVRGEKIDRRFAKAHLFARQGGERAAERLMSSS
jgi:hypothetical protein